MAGRPKKDESEKKIREAIYFEPELLEWLRQEANFKKCTVSIVVNLLVEEKKEIYTLNNFVNRNTTKTRKQAPSLTDGACSYVYRSSFLQMSLNKKSFVLFT